MVNFRLIDGLPSSNRELNKKFGFGAEVQSITELLYNALVL